MKMTVEECLTHIPQRLTAEIREFAIEEAFKAQRYIFVKRDGKYRTGYCSYCHKFFDADTVRHNHSAICPACDSKCLGKATGMGRKNMFDEVYFTYYMKSAIDPNVIVAIGTYAVRDFYCDYRLVETKFIDKSLYVFQPGIGGTAFHRWVWYNRSEQEMRYGDTYTRAGSCKCQFTRDHNAHIPTTYSRESIAASVAGTPFQHSTWEQYQHGDMTDFFDLFSRYPCVEYISKIGLRGLVEEKLNGDRTYGAINWRGKTLEKVLRITKQDLRAVDKNLRRGIGFDDLKIMQAGKKDNSGLSLIEAKDIANVFSSYIDEFLQHKQYGNIRTIYNYLLMQIGKENRYKTIRDVFLAWRDYINDCIKLDYDLTKERTCFPNKLYHAHQKTIKLVKHKGDEILNKKIQHRVEKIRHLYFEDDGLLIRPAVSTQELIAEGKALEHCVGGYAKGYAEGKGDILFIRRTAEPDKSYFTVEVRRDEVTQCRGGKNKMPEKDVEGFISKFKKERLEKQIKTNKKREVAL